MVITVFVGHRQRLLTPLAVTHAKNINATAPALQDLFRITMVIATLRRIYQYNSNAMKTNIGITPSHAQSVATGLSKLLADEFILSTKTRNAHWNIEGSDFHAMHLFLESQYNQLDDIIDQVAERIRSIGHYAPATLKNYLALTRLTEEIRSQNDSHGFLGELLADHEQLIILLREDVKSFAEEFKDIGTSDFVTGLLETHEKMAWMLRAHSK
jgi:starvation-inducible DNA-binding protein